MTENPFSPPEVKRLARELARLRGQVEVLQRGQGTAQAGRSSLDGGTWVVKDLEGNVRQVHGTQPDGTVTTVDMNGPTPPTPADPVVTPVPGGLKVSYGGGFLGGVARPADVPWIEVHVDLDPGFEVENATLDAALSGRGSVTFATDDYVPHTIRLVARNTSGVRSAPSGAVTATPGLIGPGDVAPGGIGTVELDDGAVTPPKSGTGVTSNLVPDPGFNDAGWRAKRTSAPWGFVDGPSVGFAGSDWAAFCGPTTTRAVLSATGTGDVPVIPGEVYYIAYDAGRSPAGAGLFGLEVVYLDSTGAVVTPTEEDQTDELLTEVRAISSLPTSTFDTRHGQVTIPANVAKLRVRMVRDDDAGTSAGQLYLDRVELRSVVTQANNGERVETSPSGVIVFDANGQPIGSINADGSLSMVTGQFNDGLTYKGDELGGLLDQRARGEIARVDAGFNASPTTTTEVVWLEFEANLEQGRAYKLRSSGLIARGTGQRGLLIRYTVDGTRPLVTSPNLAYNDTALGGTFFMASDIGALADAGPVRLRMVATVKSWGGTSVYWDPADVALGFSMWVEDVGPRSSSSGGVVTPEGTDTGGGGTAPPPAPVIKRFTTIFPATWSQSWRQGNVTRATNAGGMWQGYYDSFNGDNASIFGFDFPAIQAALAGATIIKFRVYLYAEHWYYNAGGTVHLGTTNVGTPPGSFPAVSSRRAFWNLGKPEGRWVTLNAGVTIGTEMKNGTTRALVLDPRPYGRELQVYGRFSGAGTPAGRNPAIEITYDKAV